MTTEIKTNSDTEKVEKTEIKTNSSYIYIVAIIAILSVCLFALYIFSHGQTGNNSTISGLPYY